MFGKNIKKIRGVKRLSQQAFADLFGLKRGTLAAYEEGRSNPRLETVIKIASHFNIDMDELLKTELTVNRLLQFNDAITTNADPLPVQQFASIPCLIESLETDFIHQRGSESIHKKLPRLQLPLPSSKGYIGYTVHSAEMSKPGGGGFLPRDIVIGKETGPDQWPLIKAGTPVLALSQDLLVFRKGSVQDGQLSLMAETEGLEIIVIDSKDLIRLWEIQHVFQWRLPHALESFEERLKQLEKQLQLIRKDPENG